MTARTYQSPSSQQWGFSHVGSDRNWGIPFERSRVYRRVDDVWSGFRNSPEWIGFVVLAVLPVWRSKGHLDTLQSTSRGDPFWWTPSRLWKSSRPWRRDTRLPLALWWNFWWDRPRVGKVCWLRSPNLRRSYTQSSLPSAVCPLSLTSPSISTCNFGWDIFSFALTSSTLTLAFHSYYDYYQLMESTWNWRSQIDDSLLNPSKW